MEEQAWSMAKRTSRIYGGKPIVTIFKTRDDLLLTNVLNILVFEKPVPEWARFVLNNRNRSFAEPANLQCNIDNKYDIVSGPIANDDLITLLDLYIAGSISDTVLTAEMTFRKMTNQISFHTSKAISELLKTGVKYG
jgi:hypothetical protein